MVFAQVIICFCATAGCRICASNFMFFLFTFVWFRFEKFEKSYVLACLLLCILALKDGFGKSNYMFLCHCWLSHLSTLLCFIARWGSKQKGTASQRLKHYFKSKNSKRSDIEASLNVKGTASQRLKMFLNLKNIKEQTSSLSN